MSDTLIINGVDWLDPRMIGLECWFSNGGTPSNFDPYLSILTNIIPRPQKDHNDLFQCSTGDYYSTCRLAQGEKTPYDGKGQPVPDGVEVELWYNVQPFESVNFKIAKAEWVNWNCVSHYQIQEQKTDFQKSLDDAIEHGLCPMEGRRHLPMEDVYIDPNAELEELKNKVAEYGRHIVKLKTDRDRYKDALSTLVAIKHRKSITGRDQYYMEQQPLAWDVAFDLIKRG